MFKKKYFKPSRFIAHGIYNEHFDNIRRFRNGIGWKDLPSVKEDARKFRQGLLEIGINNEDITDSHNLSFDDFDQLFKDLNFRIKANTIAGEKTLVILDVASYGMQKNFVYVMCNDNEVSKMKFPFEE